MHSNMLIKSVSIKVVSVSLYIVPLQNSEIQLEQNKDQVHNAS